VLSAVSAVISARTPDHALGVMPHTVWRWTGEFGLSVNVQVAAACAPSGRRIRTVTCFGVALLLPRSTCSCSGELLPTSAATSCRSTAAAPPPR
jgi:hypothetical protein